MGKSHDEKFDMMGQSHDENLHAVKQIHDTMKLTVIIQ
jgi:hypothetical protein